MVDRRRQRADLVFQRQQRTRIGKIADGLADLLEPFLQRRDFRIGSRPAERSLFQLFPAAVHRADRFLAGEFGQRLANLFHLGAQEVEPALVAAFGHGMDRVRKPLHLRGKRAPVRTVVPVGVFDVLAQHVEFLAHTGCHLGAHLLPQGLEFAGDVGQSERRDCRLRARALQFLAEFSERAFEIGRACAFPRCVGSRFPDGGALVLAGQPAGSPVRFARGASMARLIAAEPGFEVVQCAVQILKGGARAALPALVQIVEIRPVAAHWNACLERVRELR